MLTQAITSPLRDTTVRKAEIRKATGHLSDIENRPRRMSICFSDRNKTKKDGTIRLCVDY